MGICGGSDGGGRGGGGPTCQANACKKKKEQFRKLAEPGSAFCMSHKCNSCGLERFKNRPGAVLYYGSVYCKAHKCIFRGCKEKKLDGTDAGGKPWKFCHQHQDVQAAQAELRAYLKKQGLNMREALQGNASALQMAQARPSTGIDAGKHGSEPETPPPAQTPDKPQNPYLAGADDDDEPPDELCCAITTELMVDPATTVPEWGDHPMSYEYGAITCWLDNHDTCPMTRKNLAKRDLKKSEKLKRLVMLWKEAHPNYEAMANDF